MSVKAALNIYFLTRASCKFLYKRPFLELIFVKSNMNKTELSGVAIVHFWRCSFNTFTKADLLKKKEIFPKISHTTMFVNLYWILSNLVASRYCSLHILNISAAHRHSSVLIWQGWKLWPPICATNHSPPFPNRGFSLVESSGLRAVLPDFLSKHWEWAPPCSLKCRLAEDWPEMIVLPCFLGLKWPWSRGEEFGRCLFNPTCAFQGCGKGQLSGDDVGLGVNNVPQPTGQGWAQLGFCGRQVALLFYNSISNSKSSSLCWTPQFGYCCAEKEKPQIPFHHISAQLGLCDWQVVFLLHLQCQITGLSSFLNPIVLGHY